MIGRININSQNQVLKILIQIICILSTQTCIEIDVAVNTLSILQNYFSDADEVPSLDNFTNASPSPTVQWHGSIFLHPILCGLQKILNPQTNNKPKQTTYFTFYLFLFGFVLFLLGGSEQLIKGFLSTLGTS